MNVNVEHGDGGFGLVPARRGRRAALSAQECRALATLGMSEAEVERDTSGNARLHKRDWRKRDDVAASLLLASGAVRRWPIATPFAMASL